MRQVAWQMLGAVLLLLSGATLFAAQNPGVDPFSLPMVQAACGPETSSPPRTLSDGESANTPLRAGMARIYVITETRGLFGTKGKPVRLGLDGRWFGTRQSKIYSYSFVDVSPGVHHLCIAAKVKGVLPHTSAGVLLARVDAAANHSYFFYNQYLHMLRTLTLTPISVDDGPMYLQTLPSSAFPKLWKTPAAQAACGVHPEKMPTAPPPPLKLPGAPTEGHALVYFFSGVPHFRTWSNYMAIHVGVDQRWIGETRFSSYLAVPMTPGKHRVCTATKLIPGIKPQLHVGKLDLVAGKTYFVDTDTLQPVDQGLAVVWLRRIAAMPKSDKLNRKTLNKWSNTNFPASPEELRACGIPDLKDRGKAPLPPLLEPIPRPKSQVYFLLMSDIGRLHPNHAVDVGFDGRWVAELQTATSLASISAVEGDHNVCIHIGNGSGRRNLWFAPDSTLFLARIHVVRGANFYFKSHVTRDISGEGFWFRTGQLDPDEGAMLVAYWQQINTLHTGSHAGGISLPSAQ